MEKVAFGAFSDISILTAAKGATFAAYVTVFRSVNRPESNG
jgi:hypothetical protein